jgi:hypothetical protein
MMAKSSSFSTNDICPIFPASHAKFLQEIPPLIDTSVHIDSKFWIVAKALLSIMPLLDKTISEHTGEESAPNEPKYPEGQAEQ